MLDEKNLGCSFPAVFFRLLFPISMPMSRVMESCVIWGKLSWPVVSNL